MATFRVKKSGISKSCPSGYAQEIKRKVEAFSMGAKETFNLAEKAIVQGVKQGYWVILRNVHF